MSSHAAPFAADAEREGAIQETNAPRVALWMTQEEADAMMSVLLSAPPIPIVSDALTERLLCRVADAQRALDRASRATDPRPRPLRQRVRVPLRAQRRRITRP